MKRTGCTFLLLAALSGCAEMDQRPSMGGWGGGSVSYSNGPSTVPGAQGPWGQPVCMAAPYSASPPGAEAARAMMSQSVPMDMIQQAGYTPTPGAGSGITRTGGQLPPPAGISPAGMPFQPVAPGMGTPPPGAVAAVGALTGSAGGQFPSKRTEVRFIGPAGMKVSWFGASPTGQPVVASHLEAPGRYNFVQAAIYRLKLSNIPNRPGLELYPTLEVVPSNARSDTFLAHSAVPVAFTDEDFDQVAAGNYVVKVVYLPDPQFQDLAVVGPDELVSTRLQPGADPIAEAYRRGSILLVVRLGNIDLEAPGTPAMNAPSPYSQQPGRGASAAARPMMPGGQMPGMAPGGQMAGPGGQQVPAIPVGRVFQTPNGPMMMSPNGPVLLGPNGPVPMPSNMPAAGANGSGAPASQKPSAGTSPVSTLPDPSKIQQMQYNSFSPAANTTTAGLAGQATDASAFDKKPASRHWWFPGDSPSQQ
ncbi:MAG TPA: hypothetical protein VK395_15740 [Gemmataceae bacterium]|nr:hypothetical protein [Gemmataceae bacterium]